MEEVFDSNYFESGIASGKSLYENYRWIPELTIPMAMTLIDTLGIGRFNSVLDIGCSKGYLVKAFRLLYREAWGIDVSSYAIAHADPEVKDFCIKCNKDHSRLDITLFPAKFNFAIAKDVFEHIPPPDLSKILIQLKAEVLFVVVPLGDGNEYVVPAYNMDVTHIIKQTSAWWSSFFEANGWSVSNFSYRVPGIKDNWISHPYGNGFFTLTNKF